MKVEDPATELIFTNISKYYRQAVPNSGRLIAVSPTEQRGQHASRDDSAADSEVAGNKTRRDGVLHGMGLKPL